MVRQVKYSKIPGTTWHASGRQEPPNISACPARLGGPSPSQSLPELSLTGQTNWVNARRHAEQTRRLRVFDHGQKHHALLWSRCLALLQPHHTCVKQLHISLHPHQVYDQSRILHFSLLTLLHSKILKFLILSLYCKITKPDNCDRKLSISLIYFNMTWWGFNKRKMWDWSTPTWSKILESPAWVVWRHT